MSPQIEAINEPAQRLSWPAPGEALEHEELRAAVRSALDALTPREALALRLRYGQQELTLRETGAALEVSTERVRQIEHKALAKLRSPKLAKALREHADAIEPRRPRWTPESELPFWEREKLERARAAEREKLERAKAAEREQRQALERGRAAERDRMYERQRAARAAEEAASKERTAEIEKRERARAAVRHERSWWICSKDGVECASCGDPVHRGEVFATVNTSGAVLHRQCSDELGPGARVIKKFELRESSVRLPAAAEARADYARLPLTCPLHVFQAARALIGDELQEVFVVFLLNVRHEILGFVEAHRGGVDACPVDPRVVFRAAVFAGASAVVVAHNHPSGNLSPSTEDSTLTARLVRAGELLGIRVLDHVIVNASGHFSLAEKGAMPGSQR